MKKTINDMNAKGKRVLVRCDFNVPMKDGVITDDTRIRAAIPTINRLVEMGACVVLMSHMGRPKGEVVPELSLKPVAARLADLLKKDVAFIGSDKVIDEEVLEKVQALKPGEIALIENLRFRAEETKDDEAFAGELAKMGDVFVQEAFGTVHRAHSSTHAIAKFLPVYSGLLVEKEIAYLGEALNNPKRPLVAIMGGAKVKDKLPVIENLLKKVDCLIIGGGMSYTFFKYQGYEVGTSIVDEESLDLIGDIFKIAEESGAKLLLPVDVVVSDTFSEKGNIKSVSVKEIPSDMMGLDIGPVTREKYAEVIKNAATVLWNGPMGVFEMKTFENGTKAVAEAIAKSEAISIIGGGDSAAAVSGFGMKDLFSHVSTGGGASLEFIEGKSLPGIEVIEDK